MYKHIEGPEIYNNDNNLNLEIDNNKTGFMYHLYIDIF